MVVYRYALKDKKLPKDRNTVYCLITEEKKGLSQNSETSSSLENPSNPRPKGENLND